VGALAIPLWSTWPALALWLVGGAIIVTAGILSRG
jgi:hypothetical protein